MGDEYAAQSVALEVLGHLERRRGALVGSEEETRAEAERVLDDLAVSYREAGLPEPYFAALREEILGTVPERWRQVARAFHERESRSFGLWRGGDVVSRVVLVFVGLVVGGLCVELPFIPIWEKWFPFALAIGAFWLPDLQVGWARRRYALELGRIAKDLGAAQPALDRHISLDALLAPSETPALGAPPASSSTPAVPAKEPPR